MSLNPASTTGLWLSWLQWKALVKSQMKLAALPGASGTVGMAPRVTGEQAAAFGAPSSSVPVPRTVTQKMKVSGCELEETIFLLDIRKKLFH